MKAHCIIHFLLVASSWLMFALPEATTAFAFRPATTTSRRRWSTTADSSSPATTATAAHRRQPQQQEQDSRVCRWAARDDDDDDDAKAVVSSPLRRNLLLLPSFLVAGTVATTLPRRAAWAATATMTSADEDGKALRLVRSSQKKLASDAVAAMVADNDYLALQQLFRTPPFSNIRKACTTLAKDDAGLKSRYQMFISALERLDATALGALRGRTVADGELTDRYRATMAALQDFETAAAAATASVAASSTPLSLQEQIQAAST